METSPVDEVIEKVLLLYEYVNLGVNIFIRAANTYTYTFLEYRNTPKIKQ